MRFVSLRELRNEPGRFRDELRSGGLVLTAAGKPIAVTVPADEDSLEETLSALRRARAIAAASRLRAAAHRTGRDRLSPAEIDREIRSARRRA